jgi:hypothetical protein
MAATAHTTAPAGRAPHPGIRHSAEPRQQAIQPQMNANAGGTDNAIRPASSRSECLIRVRLRSFAVEYSCLRRQPCRPAPAGACPHAKPAQQPLQPERQTIAAPGPVFRARLRTLQGGSAPAGRPRGPSPPPAPSRPVGKCVLPAATPCNPRTTRGAPRGSRRQQQLASALRTAPTGRSRPAPSRPHSQTHAARSNAVQPENRARRTSAAAGDRSGSPAPGGPRQPGAKRDPPDRANNQFLTAAPDFDIATYSQLAGARCPGGARDEGEPRTRPCST